jgi:hypothetical protein
LPTEDQPEGEACGEEESLGDRLDGKTIVEQLHKQAHDEYRNENSDAEACSLIMGS